MRTQESQGLSKNSQKKITKKNHKTKQLSFCAKIDPKLNKLKKNIKKKSLFSDCFSNLIQFKLNIRALNFEIQV